MYENKRRRRITRRPTFIVRKYFLMLSCFALIFSPFSSLGELAYAKSEQSNEQIVEDIEQESEVEGSDGEELESAEDTGDSDKGKKGESSVGNTHEDKNETDETDAEGSNVTEIGDEGEDSSDEVEKSEDVEEVKEHDSTIQSFSTSDFKTLAAPEDDYVWDDHGNGTVTITNYKGTDTDVTIPSVLDGKTVTTIGREVFWNKSLNSVTIPDSVIQIDREAFRFNNLKEVALPRNLEVLGMAVFASNPLEKITISESNEKFKSTTNGEGLYTKSGETIIQGTVHAVLENSTKHIGQFAFFQIGLTEVEIPNHVETIGQHAFRANNLTEIIIPNNVKEIGFSSFMGNFIETLVLSEELTTLPNDVFMNNNLKEVIVPKNITQIGQRAFSNNDLEEVTILNENIRFLTNVFSGNQTNPEELKIIGHHPSTARTYAIENDHTFYRLEELISVQSLADIEVDYGTKKEDIPFPADISGEVNLGGQHPGTQGKHLSVEWDAGNPAFDGHTPGEYIFTGEIVLHPGLKNPNNLKATVKVTVMDSDYEWSDNGDGTVTITNYKGTDTAIAIPDEFNGKAVTRIGPSAFYEKSLTEVTIPESITMIGDSAFRRNRLQKAILPNSLETLGGWVFEGNQLEEIHLSNNLTTIGKSVFEGNRLKDVTIPSNIKVIMDNAFRYNLLENVTLQEGIEKIEYFAFGNNKIKHITIPSSVKEIEYGLFVSNPLETISVAAGNQHYKDINEKGLYTIDGETIIQGTTSGEIHSDTVNIHQQSFTGLDVNSINIPDGVKTIGQGAFTGNKLQSVTIPKSVTRIENWTFFRNELIEVLVLNPEVVFVGDSIFIHNHQANPKDVIIKGYVPSTAKEYAENNNHTFEALIDKRVLKSLIEDAEDLDEDDYTPASFGALREALDTARAVYADDDATQDDVDEAVEQLEEAIKSLLKSEGTETPIDPEIMKDDLEDIINEAENLDEERFTGDSFAQVKKALEQAKEVFHKDDATDEEIFGAYANLRHAIDLLMEVEAPAKPKEDDPTSTEDNPVVIVEDDTPEKSLMINGKGSPGKLLPSTATGLFNFLAAGIGLLVIGLITIIMTRRNRSA